MINVVSIFPPCYVARRVEKKTSNAVRTRFAPSPTGYLHIGGARTALFNFLFARHHGGKFILRIEDTDKARSTKESTDAILNGMRWLGLDWDEGPFFQSERSSLYQKAADQLLASGKAYYCDCSTELLESKRSQAQKAGRKPMYDGTCRERKLGPAKNHVVRFKAPRTGETIVKDLIKGDVIFHNQELDDMILARADGSPTYNFVVVIDDIDMRMTHVIRGDDHLNNTPKQIQLYEALGAKLPEFAHVPLILGEDKSRLSKRHGATSLESFGEVGFLPAAMRNFLARLGWSHGDQEIFSLPELIEKFDLDHVGKSAGVFNDEKLLWLNHHYMRELTEAMLITELKPYIKKCYGEAALSLLQSPSWQKLLPELRERAKTMEEFAESASYFFSDSINYHSPYVAEHLQKQMRQPLEKLKGALQALKVFDEASIESAFKKVLEESGLKMKELAQAVRVALTGTTISPGIFLLIAIVGKGRSISRLDAALAEIGK